MQLAVAYAPMTAAPAARQVMQFILHSFLAPSPHLLSSAFSILTATRLQYAEQFEQQQQQEQ